jgi:SAM-dependent methyltransferase
MLELGVGTGRIAIPLADRGCRVTGIDTSPEMLRALRSKDRHHNVETVLCDMSEPDVEGRFDVIYALYNTLYALLTQDLQVRCLQSAARLLRDGGHVVIEAVVPPTGMRSEGVSVTADFQELRRVTIQLTRVDHVRQLLEYRHVHLGAGEVKVLPAVHRYVHIAELDLMAAVACLELETRHGDWTATPFGLASKRHISVYRRAGTGE